MPLELPGGCDRPQCELYKGQALAGLPGRAAQRMEGGCLANRNQFGCILAKLQDAHSPFELCVLNMVTLLALTVTHSQNQAQKAMGTRTMPGS